MFSIEMSICSCEGTFRNSSASLRGTIHAQSSIWIFSGGTHLYIQCWDIFASKPFFTMMISKGFYVYIDGSKKVYAGTEDLK